MKRLLLSLLVATLVLAVAAPVLAQDPGHSCPHDDISIVDLRACIEHAIAMGHIDNPGIGNSLLAKVDAAQTALDNEQPTVAAHILGALIEAIEAQSSKHIGAAHASHLATHTQQVIDTLS